MADKTNPDDRKEPDTFWADKSEAERALIVGLTGTPQTRPEERARFLGELRERVLVALTAPEIANPAVDHRVASAVADPRAKELIVRGDISFGETAKYRTLAEQHGLTVTIRNDPDFRGDVGLVVISDQALL